MDSVATLVLLALLTAFIGDAAASCRKMANEDMVEYFCEGGHPVDLTTVPETTEKLRISRMPLHRVTVDTFSRFGGNLWVLSCSHCEITDIDTDAFRRLVNLQQLSLDNNRLTTVRASWFEGLNYLTYLDLNYNNIHDIEDGVYNNLPGLVDLRISGNRLRCLNLNEMSHLKEMKRIFLSENVDFSCPHAVSRFLENRGIVFQQDPEWRRLASDTIDVHVPPSHEEEEDRKPIPTHRERLHPDRQPPLEESEPYATRDKHRSRQRKPITTMRPTTTPRQQEPLPRVEPRFPETRTSHVPPESPPYQVTPETPRVPPSEDIKMSGTDGPSRAEHTLMYPHSTHETTPYWSYSTPERSRAPSMTSVPLSEDTRLAASDRPPQTEHMLTYPPYIPTHETSYPTSERSRLLVVEPLEDETIGESGRPSQAGNTVTYPLYVTTSDGLERTPQGSIQITHPSSSVMNIDAWPTDNSIVHSVDPSWTQERHEQSRRPPESSDRETRPTKTPYYGHDPREMIVEEPSSMTDDDFVTTYRPVEYPDRSRTTSDGNVHYVRPSPPELMHSSSLDGIYRAPYDESVVTVHSPLQNNHGGNGATVGVRPIETTTDKPLPECPENSASKTRPAAALVTFIIVTVLGQAVVGRF